MKAYALIEEYYEGGLTYESSILYFMNETVAENARKEYKESYPRLKYWVEPITISEETV